MNKMEVSKDLCIGCGACQSICDAVFTIGEDGLANVIVDEISNDLMDEAMDALESCPTSAIFEVTGKDGCECECSDDDKEDNCECDCGTSCECTEEDSCGCNCNTSEL